MSAPSSESRVASLVPRDLDAWLDHVTASFAHKGTPRAYFERHIAIDPHCDYRGIVVVRADDRIVSSLRVFRRSVYVDGRVVAIGGIGEVSTQPQWRGRGFAALCLNESVRYMASQSIPLSSLHTSNAADYYRIFGYETIERAFAILRARRVRDSEWDIETLSTKGSNEWRIDTFQPRQFTSSSLLDSIREVYELYACQFNGAASRSEEYWCRWIRGEHEAAQSSQSPITMLVAMNPTLPAVLGYNIVQWVRSPIATESYGAQTSPPITLTISEHLLVREFACSQQYRASDGGKDVFSTLLSRAIDTASSPTVSELYVKVPLPVVSLFCSRTSSALVQVDRGFMYRTVADAGLGSDSAPAEWLSKLRIDARSRHLFFATDSF